MAPLPNVFEQAKLSHQVFHQNAPGPVRRFHLTREQAKAIVAACPSCSKYALPTLSVGVNPRGLKSCEVWQTDVTHIPEFGRAKFVHVSVDTFSGTVFASAHTGEKSSDAIKHLIQAFSFMGIPRELKTDNGPAYCSREFCSFLQQWGVEHKTGIPHSPTGQAVVERTHRDIKRVLHQQQQVLKTEPPSIRLARALFTINFLNCSFEGLNPPVVRHFSANPQFHQKEKPPVMVRDPETGRMEGPHDLVTWGRGYACVSTPTGPKWVPSKWVRPYVPKVSGSHGKKSIQVRRKHRGRRLFKIGRPLITSSYCMATDAKINRVTVEQEEEGMEMDELDNDEAADKAIIHHYMDDVLVCAPNDDVLSHALDLTITALIAAGFELQEEKVQRMPPWRYLGLEISKRTIVPQKLEIKTKRSKRMTRPQELVAELIRKARSRIRDLAGCDFECIHIPIGLKSGQITKAMLEHLLQENEALQFALDSFTGQISIHRPAHKIFNQDVQFALSLKSVQSRKPLEALTIFTDASGRSHKSVMTWKDPQTQQWEADIAEVEGSPQVAELAAVVRAFEKFPEPFNLVTDSAYVAGVVSRAEQAILQEVSNIALFELLSKLIKLVSHREHPFYVMHTRSHTELPGFIAEGNRRADALAAPVAMAPLPNVFEQAKLSHQVFHQNAPGPVRRFHLTREQAKAIVAACPSCSKYALPTLSVGVNPRGLKSCEVWQTDVTHIPEFGRAKFVHVSVDTFSGTVFASAHTGEKSSDAIKHLIQAFSFMGIPRELKTDNGPAYCSREFCSFLQQWGVEHKTGIPHSPTGQAVVERTHRDIKRVLHQQQQVLKTEPPSIRLARALFTINFLNCSFEGLNPPVVRHFSANPQFHQKEKPPVMVRDPETGRMEGPHDLVTWGRGYACVSTPTGPKWVPSKWVRPYVPKVSGSHGKKSIQPKANVWATLARSMGQDHICLTAASADDPLSTCLVGIPFKPEEFPAELLKYLRTANQVRPHPYTLKGPIKNPFAIWSGEEETSRQATLQNRAAIDYLLLLHGHRCEEFEGLCCFNLSSKAENIHATIQRMKDMIPYIKRETVNRVTVEQEEEGMEMDELDNDEGDPCGHSECSFSPELEPDSMLIPSWYLKRSAAGQKAETAGHCDPSKYYVLGTVAALALLLLGAVAGYIVMYQLLKRDLKPRKTKKDQDKSTLILPGEAMVSLEVTVEQNQEKDQEWTREPKPAVVDTESAPSAPELEPDSMLIPSWYLKQTDHDIMQKIFPMGESNSLSGSDEETEAVTDTTVTVQHERHSGRSPHEQKGETAGLWILSKNYILTSIAVSAVLLFAAVVGYIVMYHLLNRDM
ncbi:hypothetical protein DUI87_06611 [Hirundo rustica rustica]|uniref:Uncharacterized protein n=1 Tax=Hirundo rustica rustica TaxID=333673 RepID=A0A3M0KTN3_HIRRU|nr:hypothetical protein DUI87_06611 [Hirundo rustica rustica]